MFTIAKPEISSINEASLTNFCSIGFKIIFSFGSEDIDLSKKLKQHSHVFITPSNSNIFLFLKLSLHFHVFLAVECIPEICDHVYLLLLELQKVYLHTVHFLLGSSESLKQI